MRLNDPDDWVRARSRLALALGKAVIPVLLEDAPIPDAASAGRPARPVPARRAPLRGKVEEYEAGVHALVDLIADVEGVTPPRAAGAAVAADRSALPLLCDRVDQNDAAADAIRAELAGTRRRPIVLVLHGRSNEAHGAFVLRLERDSVPTLLRNRPQARGLRFVEILDRPRTDGDDAAFAQRMRERIAAGLQAEAGSTDDAALLALLRRERCTALVVVLGWLASEIAGDPLLPLRRVQPLLGRLPAAARGMLVGCIVCVKYDAAPARGGLLRRWFGGTDPAEALRAAVRGSAAGMADERVAWCVADELPSVTFADLHRWTLAVSRASAASRCPRPGCARSSARPASGRWRTCWPSSTGSSSRPEEIRVKFPFIDPHARQAPDARWTCPSPRARSSSTRLATCSTSAWPTPPTSRCCCRSRCC